MRTSLAPLLRVPMLLALTLHIASCSTPSPPAAALPTIPLPPAELLLSESESSKDYSLRVLRWLQKARDALAPSTPSSQGCRSTPASGSCL